MWLPSIKPACLWPAVVSMQVGEQRFYTDLFMVGLLYHLYNQVRPYSNSAGHSCCLDSSSSGHSPCLDVAMHQSAIELDTMLMQLAF